MTTDPRGGNGVEDLCAVSRAAADRLDERPSATVRAAVLAAAARAVDAEPRDARSPIVARRRRWPMSVAAVLMVSVIAGLVATHAVREAPDRIAAATPRSDAAATVAQADAVTSAPVAKSDAPVPAPAERSALPATANPQDPRSAAKKQAPEPRAAAPAPPATRSASRPQPAGNRPPAAASDPEPFREVAPAPSFAADAAGAEAEDRNEAARARAPTPRMALAERAAPKALTPQAWVERVVALRRAGRAEDADRELDALRRHYPEFVIPADALAPTGTR